MRIRLVILVVFGCFCHLIQAQNIKESTVEVVLLAGQSNMAGAGNYDELDEAIRNRVEEVSHRVSLSFNGNAAKPLAFYNNKPSEKYPFLKRFGPELLLGVILAEKYPSKEFLLIKRSQGGTALYGAWNPFWKEKKAKKIEKGFKQNLKLFNMHVVDIYKNLEDLTSKGKTYQIIGLAWMQGENDAILKVAAKSYQKNLKKLVKAYRKTFNVPKMPIVIGQINSRYGIDGGANLVRQNMEKFVKKDKYATIIKTSTDTSWSDFPKHTDNVHYNTEGQKRLGIAFAKAFYF